MSLIDRGATGSVYQLNAFIAVKRARKGEDEQTYHANEQKTFRILERHSPIPYLVRCYYQRPNDKFLEFSPNGCIATRNAAAHKFSRLEKIGLAHGDIGPGNMLLDADWNLKLSGFDRAMNIGEEIVVLAEPFGRLLNKEDCGCAGNYGKAGARTETLAIGSIYYTLLHAHEPYETETWDKDQSVILSDIFQNKDFPPISDSSKDVFIRKCWDGEYKLVRDLLNQFLGNAGQDERVVEDQHWLEIQKKECKAFIQNG